jgi:hypothetical protein
MAGSRAQRDERPAADVMVGRVEPEFEAEDGWAQELHGLAAWSGRTLDAPLGLDPGVAKQTWRLLKPAKGRLASDAERRLTINAQDHGPSYPIISIQGAEDLQGLHNGLRREVQTAV